MILSGNRIFEEIQKGNIEIDPFDKSRLNPNSYNVRLADELLTYDHAVLDMKVDEPYTIEKIPYSGKLLIPGKLYLARTIEKTRTNGFVPMIEGRSSVGKEGLFIHITAGFGDNGFEGYWTLELSCVQPIKIYPEVEIGQLYFHTILDCSDEFGERGIPITYNGKYQGSRSIERSKIFQEFKN